MFLSKLDLNPRSREARRDLARPYELHRTLAHAFPTPLGQDYRATHGVLFRVESGAVLGAPPTVLVQSITAPVWQALPADYLLQLAQCKPLAPTLAPGQVLGFRLLANPTKKVTAAGQRQGKRVALLDTSQTDELTPAQQWLRRKAELSGFEVLHSFAEAFSPGNRRSMDKANSLPAKEQLPLYGVRFDGLLRVHLPELLTQAIQQGIGPAKAFGFGLLSLTQSKG